MVNSTWIIHTMAFFFLHVVGVRSLTLEAQVNYFQLEDQSSLL